MGSSAGASSATGSSATGSSAGASSTTGSAAGSSATGRRSPAEPPRRRAPRQGASSTAGPLREPLRPAASSSSLLSAPASAFGSAFFLGRSLLLRASPRPPEPRPPVLSVDHVLGLLFFCLLPRSCHLPLLSNARMRARPERSWIRAISRFRDGDARGVLERAGRHLEAEVEQVLSAVGEAPDSSLSESLSALSSPQRDQPLSSRTSS